MSGCSILVFAISGLISASCIFFRWGGVCEEGKVPYGQIIHISADQGSYVAKSYSPWQLATVKNGTPVFEISHLV